MTDSIIAARQAARLEAVEQRLTRIERRLDRVLGDERQEAEIKDMIADFNDLMERGP